MADKDAPDLLNRLRLFALPVMLLTTGCPSPPAGDGVPEEVIRHNILGTAYLGQQNWTDAATEFLAAAALRPDDPLPLNNTAVARIQQGDTGAARERLEAALSIDPDHPYAHYNLGLIDRNNGAFEEAATHFAVVAEHDPMDLLTQYNLGSVLARLGRDGEAERAFRAALERDPTHVSTLYGLGRFLLQRDRADEGAELIALSQEIRSRSALDTAVGSQYGDQGPYAMGVDYPGNALAAPGAIPVSFSELTRSEPIVGVTGRSGDTGPAWTAAPGGPGGKPRVIFGGGGRLRELTASGASAGRGEVGSEVLALVAGNVDNQEPIELIVLRDREDGPAFELLRADDDGWIAADGSGFPTGPAFRPQGDLADVDATLVDRDHDGDLDLFACWSDTDGPHCLLATNDGSGRFTTRGSDEHGFSPTGEPGPLSVGFSDLDNDRDIDLVLGMAGGVLLYSNQRDGTFDDVSDRIDLSGVIDASASLAIADLNKDGWMDLVLGGSQGLRLLVNGRDGFVPSDLPVATAGAPGAATVADIDNDGFLDLIHSTAVATYIYRNRGASGWQVADISMPPIGRVLQALDADEDGDLDLVILRGDGGLSLWSNDGGNTNHWIAVESRGVGDNAYGIGAKVELLAGALRQKFEVTGPLALHAGLGQRATVESVRYVWPSGVLQDEVEQKAGGAVEVTQLDRKGTSCPLLYAWRNGGWTFVTDFLGGAAIGYQLAPGRFGTPDTDEYVRIPGGLATEDGLVRLRLNNQLEEVIWFDQVQLLAVDHPVGTEVFANERLMPGPPWPPFELFVSSEIRPIRSARGIESGDDLTGRLMAADGRTVRNFELLPFKGYAELHTVELNLGPFEPSERIVLLLDGWIDYADSSANVAAHQAGARLVPPRMLVADGRGGWTETIHRMGFPAGLPKTMVVELTGEFPGDDHRVRIETTMRIYWDRARLLIGGEGIEPVVRRIAPGAADLRFGGFPRALGPSGPTPVAYDPEDVLPTSTWKAHVGAYTGFGDVLELLQFIDDRFVTTRSGDELELRFQAPPPPGPGGTRTWFLFADGFGKDMDPNSAASAEVGPIPYHGMPSYPYHGPRVPPASGGDRPVRRVNDSDRGWPGATPQALASRTVTE